MSHDQDIQVVAAMVAANAILSAPEWENYPDIGEYDWIHVLVELHRLATTIAPEPNTYKAAYEALSVRAEP